MSPTSSSRASDRAGAATGGLVGALTDYGVSEADSRYYEERVGHGGVVVTVDLTSSGANDAAINDILYNGGGHNSTRSRPLGSTMGAGTMTGGTTAGSMLGDTDVVTHRTTTTTTY